MPYEDSDIIAALLALLSVVAHPDDSLPPHVRMTLAELLRDDLNDSSVSADQIRGPAFGTAGDWLAKVKIEDLSQGEGRGTLKGAAASAPWQAGVRG
jgi:hypothetical protein